VKVLIRGDDLGYSEGVNYGIQKAVRDGLIRSIGFMTNMPATEHGLGLMDGLDVCLGLHTNISSGIPLTDPEKIPSLTQPNGEFKRSTQYRSASVDLVVFDEVIVEIEAQLRRFMDLTGRRPCYFEGHAVPSANFFKGLQYVAEKYELKYSGMSLDGQPILIGHTLVYMDMEGMKPGYEPYSALRHMLDHAHEDGCNMFVCHPGYLDGYILAHSTLTMPRPLEVDMVCDPATKALLDEKGATLVTYNDL